ncbi:ribonuclease HI [Georgenia soli]|uniref:ribonuclease H n=1 Tax=Georgenia soli TaxID=638953 RepID=A0A2A9EGM2_9MICO|nr:ribonuclease H [Georgenia soli]PFG38074.1 ribonuclease HI [Georgenia soli]
MPRKWSTQTELGQQFGLTARQIGTHLTELGLKDGPSATEKALADGLAAERTLKDGTPFFVWHGEKIAALLTQRGLTPSAPGAPAASGRPATSKAPARARKAGAAADTPPRPTDGYDTVIATDGSALGNPGPTGWAWVDQATGESGSGGLPHGTNNIGELLALREALRHVGPDADLLVRADSQYVINIATKWAKGWKRRGWRKGDGKIPENLELIKEIDELLESRRGRTDFEWVRGHTGDEHNERADVLAVAAAKAASSRGTPSEAAALTGGGAGSRGAGPGAAVGAAGAAVGPAGAADTDVAGPDGAEEPATLW